MTSKVIWHVMTSLDGYISGPDDSTDWMFEVPGTPSDLATEVIAHAGAVLVGGKVFGAPGFDTERNRPYGSAYDGPVIVFTHKDPAQNPNPAWQFVGGDIRSAVATARTAAGAKDVIIFGAELPRQAIEAGLLDEIVIHLAPILLGTGTRLHAGPSTTNLELLTTEGPNFRYRVLR